MPRRRNTHQAMVIDSDDDGPSGSQRPQTQNRRTNNGDNVSRSSQRSQARRTQNTQFIVDDDDDVSYGTQASQRTQTALGDEEINRLMGHVVRYILVNDRSRLPILRQNIQKSVLNNSKHYRQIMDSTRTTFRKVFGYNLLELESGKYILVNAVSNSDLHLTFPLEKNQMVLLMICLSHIFMNDDVSTEDLLFNFLRRMSIVIGDDFKHEYFGDIRHLITVEFIKQRYLIRSKVDNSEPEKFQYQWGPRADCELNKLEVLKCVSRTYRNKPVQDWVAQLKSIGNPDIPDDD